MLAPKKVKFRKWQKGRLRGLASRGASIAFGDIGLKAVQHGQLSSQQIEAARIAMMRHIKRGGKVWIRVFPDRPVTAKPLETRQGSGKGASSCWCWRSSRRPIYTSRVTSSDPSLGSTTVCVCEHRDFLPTSHMTEHGKSVRWPDPYSISYPR